jgi:hypothetical protein
MSTRYAHFIHNGNNFRVQRMKVYLSSIHSINDDFISKMEPNKEKLNFQEGIIERRLVLEKGRFMGPASYYDYENNRWKD